VGGNSDSGRTKTKEGGKEGSKQWKKKRKKSTIGLTPSFDMPRFSGEKREDTFRSKEKIGT